MLFSWIMVLNEGSGVFLYALTVHVFPLAAICFPFLAGLTFMSVRCFESLVGFLETMLITECLLNLAMLNNAGANVTK